MHYFLLFLWFQKKFWKKNIEQSNWRKGNQIRLQMKQPHHHDLGLCGGKCHIFPKPRRQIWCGYFSIIEGLIVKDIPLTLYAKTENVINRNSVFIVWDHNGINVKYLPCAFKRVYYVLDVSNFLEDFSNTKTSQWSFMFGCFHGMM